MRTMTKCQPNHLNSWSPRRPIYYLELRCDDEVDDDDGGGGGGGDDDDVMMMMMTTMMIMMTTTMMMTFVCWLLACFTSQQHASVSQGRICSDNFTCCHTEIEIADQTSHLTQSQYTGTGQTSPSADPITPGAW